MRNPFDRAVSQFVYLERRPDLRTYLGLSEGASFDEYLELVNGVTHVQWVPQHTFLTDSKTGDLLVDQIIRFERLFPEMNQVLEVLGVKCKSFPHLDAGVRGHCREWYSKRGRKAVEDFYAKDLEFLIITFEIGSLLFGALLRVLLNGIFWGGAANKFYQFSRYCAPG